MSLAKTLKGDIIAVDLFEEFLEKLKENSAKENTTANIKTLSASMDKLPFEKEELDIIWSEGAVYNIGFKNVFLESMIFSWFSKQTSFKNLAKRPLAMF